MEQREEIIIGNKEKNEDVKVETKVLGIEEKNNVNKRLIELENKIKNQGVEIESLKTKVSVLSRPKSPK